MEQGTAGASRPGPVPGLALPFFLLGFLQIRGDEKKQERQFPPHNICSDVVECLGHTWHFCLLHLPTSGIPKLCGPWKIKEIITVSCK